MSDLRRRIDRKLRDASTRRFARAIGASVLATVIGGAVISYATRETPHAVASAPKSSERLAAGVQLERPAIVREIPTALPSRTGAATVTEMPVVQASAPVVPVRAATRIVETAPRRQTTVAALPPVRPAERVTFAEAEVAAVAREPVRIFGWGVPGSDLLPTGTEAAQSVSELGRHVGRQVASIGDAIGERVGLR